jgi:hypothetical protein
MAADGVKDEKMEIELANNPAEEQGRISEVEKTVEMFNLMPMVSEILHFVGEGNEMEATKLVGAHLILYQSSSYSLLGSRFQIQTSTMSQICGRHPLK